MRNHDSLPKLLALLVIILLYPVASSMAQTPDDVLVLVNEVPITRHQLEIEIGMLRAETNYQNRTLTDFHVAGLSRKLVENLIQRELLYQKAQRKSINIQKRWVIKSLAEFKAKLKSATIYQDYLQKATLDEQQLKARIRKGLIIRRLLRREVIRQIKVSEAEMQAYYRNNTDFFIRQEQIRIRQIQISVDADASDDISNRGDALLRIQDIQNKLLEGGNFAAMALEFSEDSSSTNGGDLGYLERNQIIEPLAEAAFSLQNGEVSDIIETRLGYHIVQLVDRIPSSQLAYRNARMKIERTLRRNKENATTKKYLAKLKRQASIRQLALP